MTIPNMSVRFLLCLLLGFISIESAQQKQPGPSNPTQIRVGIIKDGGFFEGNAGCSLQWAADDRKHNERFVFLSDYGEIGLINMDGKDIKLKLRAHKNALHEEDDLKVGSKSTDIFDGPGFTVKVHFVTTWVCPADAENCEVIRYDATIVVTRGKSRKTIKTKGSCGS